jgi:hypothetical protein
VVEEPVSGGHLDGRVDALVALKVLDDQAVVRIGDLRRDKKPASTKSVFSTF